LEYQTVAPNPAFQAIKSITRSKFGGDQLKGGRDCESGCSSWPSALLTLAVEVKGEFRELAAEAVRGSQ
jgi:hypothetical protein